MRGGDKITRRSFVAGATAGSMLAVGGARAQQALDATGVKGPRVWLDLDQKELDDAYDQLLHAPNRDQILKRCARNSELARERIGAPQRISYGTAAVEGADVYLAKSKGAPISVFIHGGGWRAGVAKNYAHHAEMIVKAGAHLVVVDFNNVVETGGNLLAVADQLRRAIIWVWKNAENFGGDPERIFVCGHSTGAHLAAVMLTTDFLSKFDLPPNMLKGGVCASGIYDLKPVRLAKRFANIKFTDETEQQLSPQRNVDKLLAPLVVVYGTAESLELQRQSRDFAGAVTAARKKAALIAMEGYNHYEVLEQLGNPLSLFGRAVLHQMKLAPA